MEKDNHPMVSIIVPVFNGENAIEECIQSLLDQDYPRDKYEIIIVDNNSKDGTGEIIKRYPVLYLLEDEIQSSYAARNKGIGYAQGEIFAFTDSDCVASKNWLKEAMLLFKEDLVGCVTGEVYAYKPLTAVEKHLERSKELSNKDKMFNGKMDCVPTCNAIYRRSIFEKIGFFDATMKSGGDVDLAWRMHQKTNYQIEFCPGAVVYHKHRADLRSLWRQKVLYGYAHVVLYKKYRDNLGNHSFKDTCRHLKVLLGALKAIPKHWLKYLAGNSNTDDLIDAHLNFLKSLAYEVGRIKGSIKERVWYL